MTDDAHELNRMSDIDWSSVYAAIGEFITEYEKITTNLRYIYSAVLQADGLKTWDLGANILHIPSIGPRDLSICLCAAVKKLVPDNDAFFEDANAILRETNELAKMRNEIAHGEWYIGPEIVIISDRMEVPEKVGVKRKVTKSGVEVISLPTVSEFKLANERVRHLVDRIKILRNKLTLHFYLEDKPLEDTPRATP